MTREDDRELPKTAYGDAVHLAAPPGEVAGLMDAWCAAAPQRRSWTPPAES
jgi:hypothetical protein